MAPPRHSARPVTARIGNRTRSGGRSDTHPLPPRQVPGSLAGAAASTVFMLAPSVHGPLAELAISRLSEHIPLRRYGEPEEFGWAAAFVLSPPRPTSPAR